jgi:hypothetical protein
MLNSSGKAVDCLRVIPGTSSGYLSPVLHNTQALIHTVSVKVRLIHDLSDLITPNISPSKIRNSPLIEHTLYPVSTAPINNPTKRN